MKIMQKMGVIVGTVILSAGMQVAAAADTVKVGVVNVQKILQQSPRVAELSKKLEAQFKGRQTKLGDEQNALQDALNKFKKDSPAMTQQTRDSTEKKLTEQRADLVKQAVAYQQDVQKEQNRIMQGILKDLNTIVSDMARQQSLDMVFDSQALVYSKAGVDMTNGVATKFNALH